MKRVVACPAVVLLSVVACATLLWSAPSRGDNYGADTVYIYKYDFEYDPLGWSAENGVWEIGHDTLQFAGQIVIHFRVAGAASPGTAARGAVAAITFCRIGTLDASIDVGWYDLRTTENQPLRLNFVRGSKVRTSQQ